MRFPSPAVLSLTLATAALGFASTASAQSVSVNFNDPADLTLFSQRTGGAFVGGGAPTSTALTYTATGGISGSGAVTRSGGPDVTAVYLSNSFDLTSNQPFTFAIFLKTGTTNVANTGSTMQ